MMLYKVLKRMIERGITENITEKLDVFYAADKITEEEYSELISMITPSSS